MSVGTTGWGRQKDGKEVQVYVLGRHGWHVLRSLCGECGLWAGVPGSQKREITLQSNGLRGSKLK